MGLFDGRSYSAGDFLQAETSHNRSSSHHRSHSRSRGISPARSTRSPKSQGYYVRPGANTRSASNGSGFFSNFGVGASRGIFSSGGSSSSYYKRRPRDGYIAYLTQKLQRMVKELWYYARKHPVKAFFAVVVPLLSAGGAIHGLMKQFGVKLPFGLDGAAKHMGGGYYDSSGYGGMSSGRGMMGGGGGGANNWMDQAGGLMQIAKAFM